MNTPLIPRELANQSEGPEIIAARRKSEPDRETQWHRHARAQLFATLSGLMTVRTNAGRWVMPPGRAVWIPPDCRHAVRFHGVIDGWAVYVTPRACGSLPDTPRVVAISGLLREAICRAATWSPKSAPLDARQARIARVILDELSEAIEEPLHLPMPRSPGLAKIAHAIASNPADRRTLDDWARFGNMTKRTLTRRFFAETGMTVAEWRTRARLLVALERLVAGEAVTSIALDLGYESVSAFIAMFRRTFSTTPKKFLMADSP
ncbi:helix-turn-helix transcriptional regulator [Archangium violaceum]|uniref:AraC family transcriptional regulator n=1 Tax=Archangium violaceum TaxID=83451 RepID=UPI00193B84E4|nr:helix-turn-helix transcriptional regulator [Archangium violaceum]QRK08245.1 helix-turn-helix transcriptional regulator [Archangium violaceum]